MFILLLMLQYYSSREKVETLLNWVLSFIYLFIYLAISKITQNTVTVECGLVDDIQV